MVGGKCKQDLGWSLMEGIYVYVCVPGYLSTFMCFPMWGPFGTVWMGLLKFYAWLGCLGGTMHSDHHYYHTCTQLAPHIGSLPNWSHFNMFSTMK